jgi:hypothetical protein
MPSLVFALNTKLSDYQSLSYALSRSNDKYSQRIITEVRYSIFFFIFLYIAHGREEKHRSGQLHIGWIKLILAGKFLTFGSFSGKIVVIGKVGCIILSMSDVVN